MVLEREATREQVVEWAMHFIKCDELEIVDIIARDLLRIDGGLDMLESPGVYLYSLDDIKKWIADHNN